MKRPFFSVRRYLGVCYRDQETKKTFSETIKVGWHFSQYSNWAAGWTTNQLFDSPLGARHFFLLRNFQTCSVCQLPL